MHSLIQSLVVAVAPESYLARRIIQNREMLNEAARFRITADMIEKAIIRGTYNDARPMMCEAVLRLEDEPLHHRKIATETIMKKIFPQYFLICKLEQEGELDPSLECDFERRIILSNWYWRWIRELRKYAQGSEEMIEYYGVR
ncbi:hypothetical protein [Pseudomonas phage D6]|nr:hypothetical protein [Pseudomonas phage D6]